MDVQLFFLVRVDTRVQVGRSSLLWPHNEGHLEMKDFLLHYGTLFRLLFRRGRDGATSKV